MAYCERTPQKSMLRTHTLHHKTDCLTKEQQQRGKKWCATVDVYYLSFMPEVTADKVLTTVFITTYDRKLFQM